MSEPIVRIFDNPILIAQARRRLRPAQLVSSGLIAGLLGLCGVLLSVVAKGSKDGFSTLEVVLLFGIGVVLLLRGSNRVAEAVREERESGLLDFHRATPTTPWTDALGYLLGCPAREHLIAAVLAVFALGSAPMSKYGLPVIAGALLTLWLCALLYHGFALWIGLLVAHRRGASGIVIGTLVTLLLAGWSIRGVGAVGYFTPYPAIAQLLGIVDAAEGGVTFYGVPLHALVLTLLVQGSMLFAIGHAVVRKLRQDDATSFSRLGTLYLFGWISFLSLGAVWQWVAPAAQSAIAAKPSTDSLLLGGYVSVGTLIAAALLFGQVPSYLMLLRALRRGRRLGTAELSWLDEGGRCEPLTLGLWVLIIAGLFVLSRAMGPRLTGALLGQTVVLVVASVLAYLLFVQSASEYVRFRHRGATQAVGVFVFFASHILPWLLSLVFGGVKSSAGPFVAALSPLYAVGGAASNLSQDWLGQVGARVSADSLYVSLAATLVLSGFFFFESRRSQRALARQIAQSGKTP